MPPTTSPSEQTHLTPSSAFDPFHVVKLGSDALETVRRDIWQQLRRIGDSTITKKFKGHRWALLKNPEDLTDRQATALKAIKKTGGALWRGYQLVVARNLCR